MFTLNSEEKNLIEGLNQSGVLKLPKFNAPNSTSSKMDASEANTMAKRGLISISNFTKIGKFRKQGVLRDGMATGDVKVVCSFSFEVDGKPYTLNLSPNTAVAVGKTNQIQFLTSADIAPDVIAKGQQIVWGAHPMQDSVTTNEILELVKEETEAATV